MRQRFAHSAERAEAGADPMASGHHSTARRAASGEQRAPAVAAILAAHGMTLVEMLVVLAIVAGLLVGSISMINILTASDVRDQAMRITSVIKYSWTHAALNNAQYRLVMDLETGEYFTEVTESPVIAQTPDLDTDEGMLPEEARELENERSVHDDPFEDGESDPFGVHRPVTYQRVQEGLLEIEPLDNGVRFHKVITQHQSQPFRSGKAAISFFPDGFQEPAVIVLSDEDEEDFYSLVTEPLTGRVFIYDRELDELPEEVAGPAEEQD